MCDPVTAAILIGGVATAYAATRKADIPDVNAPKTDSPAKAGAKANLAAKAKKKQLLGEFSLGDTNVTGGTGLGPVPSEYLGKKTLLGS